MARGGRFRGSLRLTCDSKRRPYDGTVRRFPNSLVTGEARSRVHVLSEREHPRAQVGELVVVYGSGQNPASVAARVAAPGARYTLS
jgi:hypothetical protein